jgi:hypothetical protein
MTPIASHRAVCYHVMLSLHASSKTGDDNDAERDGINNQSSVNVVRVVVVQQLGGCGGWRRENDVARSTIVLMCGCRC